MYAKSNVNKIPNAMIISLMTDDGRVAGTGLTLVTVSVDVSVTTAVQVVGAVIVILVLSKRGLEHDNHCQCGGLVDELAYWLHFDCFWLLKDSSLERWVKSHRQGLVYIVSKLSKTTLFFFSNKTRCQNILRWMFMGVVQQGLLARTRKTLSSFFRELPCTSLFKSFTIWCLEDDESVSTCCLAWPDRVS